ncbi:50S ribosomal protein L29 [Pelolinea submarina]|uniref:Large ribosomal subunit protein uL29 n=1 Tax=Pelolinea submarina TaxID=913107 RepID=A0A347ZVC1_9CHLR|nr:50S ribosomal protein L29 [Pelolinea submarina]REG10160.1 LSU ribosomal protein L29P [Pelolinea submarina]BBB49252.1 large subunit ribosomal protein L29 [Pelolinea submarina]
MKVSEIRLMPAEEIRTRLLDAKKEYMNLRFQAVSGQLTDTSKLKEARRSIARFETILNEKLLEKEVEGEA